MSGIIIIFLNKIQKALLDGRKTEKSKTHTGYKPVCLLDSSVCLESRADESIFFLSWWFGLSSICYHIAVFAFFCLLQPFEHLKWLKYITYTFKSPRNGKYGRHRRKPRTKWVSLLDFYEQIKMAYRRSVKQLCYGTLILVAELFLCLKTPYKHYKNHHWTSGKLIWTLIHVIIAFDCKHTSYYYGNWL